MTFGPASLCSQAGPCSCVLSPGVQGAVPAPAAGFTTGRKGWPLWSNRAPRFSGGMKCFSFPLAHPGFIWKFLPTQTLSTATHDPDTVYLGTAPTVLLGEGSLCPPPRWCCSPRPDRTAQFSKISGYVTFSSKRRAPTATRGKPVDRNRS